MKIKIWSFILFMAILPLVNAGIKGHGTASGESISLSLTHAGATSFSGFWSSDRNGTKETHFLVVSAGGNIVIITESTGFTSGGSLANTQIALTTNTESNVTLKADIDLEALDYSIKVSGEFTIKGDKGSPKTYPFDAEGKTLSVASVTWGNGKFSKITDDNPNEGGGKRIFPGKEKPNDTKDRKTVKIKATLTQKVVDITVYFKIIDVDDPSSNKKPIDDESKNKDNFGTAVSDTVLTAVTDKNGVATIEYVVSMQPGDNFKAVASGKKDFFNGIKAEQGKTGSKILDKDQKEIPSRNITQMLTVWRKIYIERDSMGKVETREGPKNSNVVYGKITKITDDGLLPIKAFLDKNISDASRDLDSVNPANGRFENGKIAIFCNDNSSEKTLEHKIKGNGKDFVQTKNNLLLPFFVKNSSNSVVVVGDVKSLTENTFTLNVDGGTLTKNIRKIIIADCLMKVTSVNVGANQVTVKENKLSYKLYDDDLNNALPKLPDVSLVQSALKEVYILPDFNVVKDDNQNVLFQKNIPEDDIKTFDQALDWDSRNLNNENFWVAYILTAFQGPFLEDGDSNVEERLILGMSNPNTGGGMVFIETMREYDGKFEAEAVVHELGHAITGAGDAGASVVIKGKYIDRVKSDFRNMKKPKN